MVNFRQYSLAMIISDENSFSIGNLGTCFLLLCNLVARYATKNVLTQMHKTLCGKGIWVLLGFFGKAWNYFSKFTHLFAKRCSSAFWRTVTNVFGPHQSPHHANCHLEWKLLFCKSLDDFIYFFHILSMHQHMTYMYNNTGMDTRTGHG